MAAQLATGAPPDVVLRDHADRSEVSFLVLSDTGEGDASQMVVVPPLLSAAEGADFMVRPSDSRARSVLEWAAANSRVGLPDGDDRHEPKRA